MKDRKIAWLRPIAALSLLFAVFFSSSMIALAGTEKSTLAGEIIVSGNSGNTQIPAVTLNGEKVLSGHTFFSTGLISTSETGSANVNLGKLGNINLSPNSKLNLNFTDNNISGTLSAGQIKVFAKEGVSVNIQTADGIVNNDKSENGVYTINARSASTEQGGIPQGGQQQQLFGGGQRLTAALIFSAILGTAIVYVLVNDGNDNVTSPVR